MSAPTKPIYRAANWKDCNTALKTRGSLLIWLDKDMCWRGSASGKRGRHPKYSEAPIQFCLTIKGLFNLALHQAVGMAQSVLKLAGLNWRVPDVSTVIRANALLPIDTDTPTCRRFLNTPELRTFVEGLYTLKRLARTDEIARTVLYVASEASSFSTGSSLMVDGGVSINRT